ncbi:hypothetical protein J4410_05680 [Candidatus Woesearchaeota archaeon]|nr:hypothetical protein [Candidatus Woesearchaeota archaeon]
MQNMSIYKRSQLTIFMLMAVVALVIFGLVYFNRGQTTQIRIQAEEEKLVTNKMAASQVEFFVQQCLEKSFQEGLEMAASQGGYIVQEQRGSMIPFAIPYINYTAGNKTYLVAYRSTRDKKDQLPKYPCLQKDDSPEPRYCGYINDEAQYKPLSNHSYGLTKNIITDGTGSYLTIQKQLERYVENQTLECINFSSFFGFNVTFENATATAMIQDEQVSVTLFIPITVLIQDVSPVIQKFKFSSVQRIRLKKVHNAVQELLSFDNRNIDFRLREDGAVGKFKSNVFRNKELKLEIEKISNAEESDDIFVFTDAKSTLAGKPLKYMIARENRMPALDLIPSNLRNPNYDILLGPGQRLEIKPKAADPDEDNIIYSYSGFSEKSRKIAEGLEESMASQEDDCKNRCASYLIEPNDKGETDDPDTPEDESVHVITIKASDGEFTDFQNIRVKVIDSIIAVPNVYNLYTEKLDEEKKNWQSVEDPVFFDGRDSVLQEADAQYNYIWVDSFVNLTDSPPAVYNQQITTDETLKERCLVKFGNEIKPCEEADIINTLLDIKKPIALTQLMADAGIASQFSFDAAIKTDANGKYHEHNITLGINMVSGEPNQNSVDIQVKECLPYEVRASPTDHPDLTQAYPFMYARKKTDAGYWAAAVNDLSTPSKDDFNGSHIGTNIGCCTAEGKRKLPSEVCFELPATKFLKSDLEGQLSTDRSPGVVGHPDAVKILKTRLVEDSSAGNGALTVIPKKVPDLNTCTQDECSVSFKQYCGARGNACSGTIKFEVTD